MRLQICRTGSGKNRRADPQGRVAGDNSDRHFIRTACSCPDWSGCRKFQATGGEQGATRPFNIPAQSLSSVVSAFGRQSDLQVTLATPAAGNVRTNAVAGSFTVREALSRLLAGTGVNFRIAGNGRTVIIGTGESTVDFSEAAGTTVLETITVTGKSGRNSLAGAGYQGTPDWV